MPYLILNPGKSEKIIPLLKDDLTLGRSDQADIPVDDKNVSRLHARLLRLEEGNTALVDLGSSNGTYVNDIPVNRIFLMDGDEIRTGETASIFREDAFRESGGVPREKQIEIKEKNSVSLISSTLPTEIFSEADREADLENLKNSYMRLRTIYRFSAEISGIEELPDFAKKTTDALRMALDSDRCIFLLHDESGDRDFISVTTTSSPAIENENIRKMPVYKQVLESISEENAPFMFSDSEETDEKTLEERATILAAPISHKGKIKGAVYMDNPVTGNIFDKSALDFIGAVTAQLGETLHRIQSLGRLKRKNRELEKTIQENLVIVCRNPRMLEIMDILNQLAAADSTVLIWGESGTGKELIARAIHAYSRRRKQPMISINCASIPETLIESELFGHERGAFTGAVSKKPGKFELAHGGSVFLDEIGDISPAAQSKILRVLQEGELQRVGGTRDIKVDVRIIAATNKNLSEAIKTGEFREDLYYRLKVVQIDLPPLRERPEDIPVLAEYFLKQLRKKMPTEVTEFSQEARKTLLRYRWPGNVRELRNVVERALVFARGDVVKPEHLPPEVRSSEYSQPEEEGKGEPLPLSEMERRHIIRTMDFAGGNKLRAAEILGISRSTLYEKIRHYKIHS